MKVSLKWLREYVPVTLPPEELAHRLTMAGIEVGEIHTVGGSWDSIFVGRVARVIKHPNADRLTLCTVDLPNETFEVVCGAPNVAEGQNIAFARLGARLLDGHSGKTMTLKAAKIRGVVSQGMICSEKELGLSEEHEGILVLSPDAPLGAPLIDHLGDSILELEVTPNRPDCLSMLGVAWEVAALTGAVVSMPEISYEEHGSPIEKLASVEIADPDLCARYTASVVTGLEVAESPHWMQERLLAAGMRPINNIVDITNYVMLEYGQPLHAFDYDGIEDGKITVRRARAGERLLTLDGETRPLDPDMLAIADPSGPVGLAGVMGGARSEVSDKTTSVLLESASFNNVSIRRTSIRLKLRSEASLRFDKGLSPGLPLQALKRATQLLAQVAGGTVARGVIDIFPGKTRSRPLRLTSRRLEQVLGTRIEQEKSRQVLTSLGFKCRRTGESDLSVTIPYWRSDISIEDDLVEEVARIVGYDQVPITTLHGHIPQIVPDEARQLKETVQDIMAGCGMQEVVNYSISNLSSLEKTGLSALASLNPLRIANPMRPEHEHLRLSLRPGILANVAQNQKHQDQGLLFFEIGKVYLPRDGDLPIEKEILACVVTGDEEGSENGFLKIKGILESLLERLGVEVRFEPGEEPGLHPGRIVRLKVQDDDLGVLGEVHPQVVEAFDIEAGSVYVFEADMEKLRRHLPASKKYRPISRYPGVLRDLALLVDANTPARAIEDVIKSFPLVTRTNLFDVYSGDQVPQGKRSLAYRIQFQSPNRTLTEEEVNVVQAQLVQKLSQETGARLRGVD